MRQSRTWRRQALSNLGLATTTEHLEPEAEGLRRRLRRLALDVHDGPMQSLIAAGFGIGDLKRREDIDREQLLDRLDEIAAELAGAERSLRDLITTLEQSGTGELESLEEVAAAEVDRFRRGCRLPVQLVVAGDVNPDSHSQEIAIRSILREALTNVAKHAHASGVRVEVDARPTGITVEVEDDGDGFDPGSVGTDRIGLTSMRERLQFLGGSLAIESKVGGPTRVTATFRRWHAR
jgi:signal transduction histidine kinase